MDWRSFRVLSFACQTACGNFVRMRVKLLAVTKPRCRPTPQFQRYTALAVMVGDKRAVAVSLLRGFFAPTGAMTGSKVSNCFVCVALARYATAFVARTQIIRIAR
jgi:hypothetical protein